MTIKEEKKINKIEKRREDLLEKGPKLAERDLSSEEKREN